MCAKPEEYALGIGEDFGENSGESGGSKKPASGLQGLSMKGRWEKQAVGPRRRFFWE